MATRIFVGNLPFSATEDQLHQLFSQHGEVSSVSIVKDRFTERSRGFAFVEMSNADAATAAIAALSGHTLDNRPLTVNIARERTERSGGGGGRGFGGGGRPRRDSGSYGNKRW
jgi:RNA recognition motif-containing protein